MRRMCLVVLLLSACGFAHAYFVPSLNVWRLLPDSQEVWRGEILEVTDTGPGTLRTGRSTLAVHWYHARMRVDRVVKGTQVPGEAQFYFAANASPADYPLNYLPPGDYLLVMLSRQDGRLALTDSETSAMPVPQGGPPPQGEAGTPEEALAQELLRIAQSGAAQETTLGRELLDGWGLPSQAQAPGRRMALLALRQLAKLQGRPTAAQLTALVAPGLRRLAEFPPNAFVQGAALATLVRLGDAASYPALGQFLSQEQSTDPTLGEGQREALMALASVPLSQLAASYQQQTQNPLIDVLIPLFKRTSPQTRDLTLGLVMRLQDPHAIPAVVGLLDDAVPRNRWRAAIALAHLTDMKDKPAADWAPAWDAPPEKVEAAVTLWKDWWEKEGKAKYTPPAPVAAAPAAG